MPVAHSSMPVVSSKVDRARVLQAYLQLIPIVVHWLLTFVLSLLSSLLRQMTKADSGASELKRTDSHWDETFSDKSWDGLKPVLEHMRASSYSVSDARCWYLL